MADVAVIMGSGSDAPVVEPCLKLLAGFGLSYAVHISSAHRTPERLEEIIRNSDDTKVFICAAGMAAHLAGAVAARSLRPVIGIPVMGSALGGMDSLFSTVQMPSGFPVATVAINGAKNAAWLAAEILAVSDPALLARLNRAREEMRAETCAASASHAEGKNA